MSKKYTNRVIMARILYTVLGVGIVIVFKLAEKTHHTPVSVTVLQKQAKKAAEDKSYRTLLVSCIWLVCDT